MPGRVRVAATVHGKVQMVGFRAYVLDHSEGLHGTVTNRPDGTVHCLIEGDEAAVDSLVSKLHRGPAWARVETVEVVREAFRGDLPPFSVTA
ncbi:MAG: acylphosphatase [Candidatus Dormibacteria bacterium]